MMSLCLPAPSHTLSYKPFCRVVSCVLPPKAVGEKGIAIMEKEQYLPGNLRAELMPKHVAVIMDGNRRWAADRDLAPICGHSAGRKALKQLVRYCSQWGIKVLTVYAFSTENWVRQKEEVDGLMDLFEDMMISDLEELMGLGVRARVIGNKSKLPRSLQKSIALAEEATMKNSGTEFNYAMNYSGRHDIIQACKGIAKKVSDGIFKPEDVNENKFEQELETKFTEFPCPDLLIRTSGELRISNFMLWQLAYSELFFTEKLFPDFGESEFIEAVSSYQNRLRRFGGTI